MDTTLSDPMVGRLLDGRYAVHHLVASGGMASVYLATDSRLDRQVAVKVMHPGYAADPDFVARFQREARAAAALNSPNIVAVYDQGSDNGQAFLVMEYVPGHTLRTVLRERGRLSAGEALAVMDHVLAGLGSAHTAGLVHRDVKPENVLVTPDGRVKVVDFGLARAAAGANVTAATTVIGTPHYLAPEQVTSGASDARSDVFAAGVMLYELLTGAPPFPSESLQSVTYRVVHEDVPEASSRVADVPPELDALVLAATARDPQERPRDAHALHESLLAVRDRLGLHGKVPVPDGAAERPGGHTLVVDRIDAPTVVPPAAQPPAGGGPAATADVPRRRRRRWPWVLALLLVAALAAGAAGWWFAVGRYTSAPSVVGLTRAAAVAKLDHAGLKVRWEPSVYSDTIDKDRVAKESPAAGHDLRKGGTVSLALSLGRDHVPDVRGKTVSGAERLLARAQLHHGTITRQYSDKVAADLVITTTPKPGAEVSPGSEIALVVSQGPAPITVPDVTNKPLDQATAILKGLGLGVAVVQSYDDKVPQGTVMSTSPGAGATAHKGDTVSVSVSKGPHLYPVPDVRGMKVEDAIKTLKAQGFKVDVSQFPAGPDRVLAQSPGPGSMQKRGTTIHLYAF